jgi:hypothetical protein
VNGKEDGHDVDKYPLVKERLDKMTAREKSKKVFVA